MFLAYNFYKLKGRYYLFLFISSSDIISFYLCLYCEWEQVSMTCSMSLKKVAGITLSSKATKTKAPSFIRGKITAYKNIRKTFENSYTHMK